MYKSNWIYSMLIVVLLALGFPSRSQAAGAVTEHYKMPEYEYFCGTYCYEYITIGGYVSSIENQEGLGEITISGWRERTVNVYYLGNLIESRISRNFHMVNKGNLNNEVFKYKENFIHTDYTQRLTCEVTFDVLENVINGDYTLVFDHGEENCYPIP